MIRIFFVDFLDDTRSFLKTLLRKRTFSWQAGLLFLITLAAAIYRFSEINSDISHDEAYTYLAFIRGTLFQTAIDYHLPNNHIFLSLILNLVFHAFGGELWVLRIPTLVFGVLMVPATYALGKRLYNSETGMIAALAVAVFPELVHFSVIFRGYILVALFTLLAFILGDDLRRKKNRFGWLLLIIPFTLGLYTIPTMLFPFVIFYYWLFFSALVGDFGESYLSKWDFLSYWAASGILTSIATIALYSPILLFSRDDLFNNHWLEPIPWNILPERLWENFVNTWRYGTSPIPTWLAWLAVLGGVMAFLFYKRLTKHQFPLQLAFALGVITVILIQRPDTFPRVWSFSIALFLIWAAAGWVGLFSKIKIGLWHLNTILIVAMSMGVFFYSAQLIPSLSILPVNNSNFKATALFLVDELQENDLILMNATYAPMLEYELLVQDNFKDFFNQDKEYQRIILVVIEKNGENLDVLLRKFAERYRFDLVTLEKLRNYGNYQIYEVFSLP